MFTAAYLDRGLASVEHCPRKRDAPVHPVALRALRLARSQSSSSAPRLPAPRIPPPRAARAPGRSDRLRFGRCRPRGARSLWRRWSPAPALRATPARSVPGSDGAAPHDALRGRLRASRLGPPAAPAAIQRRPAGGPPGPVARALNRRAPPTLTASCAPPAAADPESGSPACRRRSARRLPGRAARARSTRASATAATRSWPC